jgi:myo-inositol 2-dehydrogenase/D-chiro-inositol 1-dehydrogenase
MMLEVALFGAGRIGKIHAGNLARRNDVKLKYVIDINAAAASELATRYGAGVGDVETAVRDPDSARRRRRQGHLLREAS